MEIVETDSICSLQLEQPIGVVVVNDELEDIKLLIALSFDPETLIGSGSDEKYIGTLNCSVVNKFYQHIDIFDDLAISEIFDIYSNVWNNIKQKFVELKKSYCTTEDYYKAKRCCISYLHLTSHTDKCKKALQDYSRSRIDYFEEEEYIYEDLN
ncbi:hypothetical protein [Carp edema virus]|nr:hypothetical protein [Carp edema virus]